LARPRISCEFVANDMNMKISDYRKETMCNDIINLFKEIYPDSSMEDIKRAAYDEKSPLHVSTKVAVINDKIVGQANAFYFQHNKTIANLGYHVHPEYQRQGIGQRLATEVMKDAKEKDIKTIVVQTEKDNVAGLKLAEKLGFSEVSKSLKEENANSLKLCGLKDGVVLHKEL
jgi:RimJ/RimL family protein N-acetyltransferase